MVSAERKQQFRDILDAIVEDNQETWNELKEEYKLTGDGIGDNEVYEELFSLIFMVSGASDVAWPTGRRAEILRLGAADFCHGCHDEPPANSWIVIGDLKT